MIYKQFLSSTLCNCVDRCLPPMASKSKRQFLAQVGQETLAIITNGSYVSSEGSDVDISQLIAQSVRATKLYEPTDFDRLLEQQRQHRRRRVGSSPSSMPNDDKVGLAGKDPLPSSDYSTESQPSNYIDGQLGRASKAAESSTVFEVTNETSLGACRRIIVEQRAFSGSQVTCLNFASAKNAGGGFLRGAKAQEESLARSSTLYASLTCPTAAPYYQFNSAIKPNRGIYSDHLIW